MPPVNTIHCSRVVKLKSNFLFPLPLFYLPFSVSISHSLPLPSSLYFDFSFLSSLSLSQLFLVGLNWWLLGLKWWVVSVVAGFKLVVVVWVLVGFHGGDWV